MPEYTVTDEDKNTRADIFLAKSIDFLNRSNLKKLFDQDKVKIQSAPIRAGYQLKPGEIIIVELPQDPHPEGQLPVIYTDDDCVVFNKPAGVLSHSKGAFLEEATVATYLKPWLHGLEGNRAGIVHRLDRGTSGVMICGRTPEACKALQRQFSQRKVVKQYYAITQGVPEPQEAVVDMPIARNPQRPQTFITQSNGKAASTYYKVVDSRGDKALVLLQPKTGRTHQLRVHLSKIGTPIVGDTLYGGSPAERLFLHATSLEITLPNKQRRSFTAPLPKEFKKVLGVAL